jgi:hypothetical protein
VLKSLLLASLAFTVSLPAASVPLMRLIPADTLFVISVDDVPRLRKSTADSPFVRAWQDTQVREWLAPLRERMDWEAFDETARANTGHTPDEVLNWVEGGALLAVRTLERMNRPDKVPPFVFVADLGKNARPMQEFLQNATARRLNREPAREEQEDYAGATIHSIIPEPVAPKPHDENAASVKPDLPLVWTVHEGLLIMAADKAEVVAILDAQREGGVRQPLEDAPRFQQVRGAVERPDLIALLQLRPLVTLVQAAFEQSNQAGKNPFAPAPHDIITGLGIDAWEDIAATWRTTPEKTVVRYRFNYTAARGLLGLFATETPSFPQPRWIPARWQNVATYRFDFGQLFPRLDAMVTTISPIFSSMAQGMAGQLTKKTGVDLEHDLFAHFGDELVVAQHFSPDAAVDAAFPGFGEIPQVFAVSLRDAGSFERAVEKLLEGGGPGLSQLISTREHHGYRVHTYASAPPPSPDDPVASSNPAFHYAFAGGYAFFSVGPVGPIEEALQAVASDSDESFWKRSDVRDALADLPRGASSFQFQDTAATLGLMVQTLERVFAGSARAAATAARESDGEETEAVHDDEKRSEAVARTWTNPGAQPNRELFARYFGPTVSYTTMDEHGIEAVSILSAPRSPGASDDSP